MCSSELSLLNLLEDGGERLVRLLGLQSETTRVACCGDTLQFCQCWKATTHTDLVSSDFQGSTTSAALFANNRPGIFGFMLDRHT